MNKQIKLLAEQAYTEVMHERGGTYMAFDKEKFAELIVQECMQACINMGNEYEIKSAGQYQAEMFAFAIKQHFGFEPDVNENLRNRSTYFGNDI